MMPCYEHAMNCVLALQIRQLREVFDGIDHAGDGTVDRAEFRRYMSHVEALRPHLTLFNEAESIFSSLDRRKNGTLCFADVRMLPLTLAPESKQAPCASSSGSLYYHGIFCCVSKCCFQ